jgi:steroid delta-isomerase-like uncharacterized protein
MIHADGATATANAERIVAFFADVLGTGDLACVSTFLATDFVDHDPAGMNTGASGVAIKLHDLWCAFPDGRYHLQEVVAAADRVVARSTFRGTQTGPFGPLPPTGCRVEVSFMDFYRVAEGKISEHWHNFDQFGLMKQLGAIS